MKLATFRLPTFLPYGVGGRVDNLTKAPYLVLFVILISISVGTASALITITLAGNVVVTGDMDVQGGITGPTVDNLQNQINSLEVQGISIETQNQIDNIEGNLTAHDAADFDVTITTRLSPGVLVASGTGVVTITCDIFINGNGDKIVIATGGTALTFGTPSSVNTITLALSGDTLTWVIDGPQDVGRCVAALLS